MSDPSPDTPNAYAPRCGHHGNPLVWLDPALRWRCPHCFPELFPDARPAAGSSSPDVTALADELRNAILDIDAHATPFGTDDDGFVSGGYLISVGSLHRALGVVGHSAAKCGGCRNCWTLDQWKAEEQLLRDELEAQAARITELVFSISMELYSSLTLTAEIREALIRADSIYIDDVDSGYDDTIDSIQLSFRSSIDYPNPNYEQQLEIYLEEYSAYREKLAWWKAEKAKYDAKEAKKKEAAERRQLERLQKKYGTEP